VAVGGVGLLLPFVGDFAYPCEIVVPGGLMKTVTVCLNYGKPEISTFRTHIDARRGWPGSITIYMTHEKPSDLISKQTLMLGTGHLGVGTPT
jgi:hypothetical protein